MRQAIRADMLCSDTAVDKCTRILRVVGLDD
jgi:hypothetical protein